jgi:hypothetical protein
MSPHVPVSLSYSVNAETPQKHQIETMVGGVAVLDYNNDGRSEIYDAGNGNRGGQVNLTTPAAKCDVSIESLLGSDDFRHLLRRNGLGERERHHGPTRTCR